MANNVNFVPSCFDHTKITPRYKLYLINHILTFGFRQFSRTAALASTDEDGNKNTHEVIYGLCGLLDLAEEVIGKPYTEIPDITLSETHNSIIYEIKNRFGIQRNTSISSYRCVNETTGKIVDYILDNLKDKFYLTPDVSYGLDINAGESLRDIYIKQNVISKKFLSTLEMEKECIDTDMMTEVIGNYLKEVENDDKEYNKRLNTRMEVPILWMKKGRTFLNNITTVDTLPTANNIFKCNTSPTAYSIFLNLYNKTNPYGIFFINRDKNGLIDLYLSLLALEIYTEITQSECIFDLFKDTMSVHPIQQYKRSLVVKWNKDISLMAINDVLLLTNMTQLITLIKSYKQVSKYLTVEKLPELWAKLYPIYKPKNNDYANLTNENMQRI